LKNADEIDMIAVPMMSSVMFSASIKNRYANTSIILILTKSDIYIKMILSFLSMRLPAKGDMSIDGREADTIVIPTTNAELLQL
jgi:hypothetical protein